MKIEDFKMKICRVCEVDKNLLNLLLDENLLLVEKLTNFVVFDVSIIFIHQKRFR